MSVICNHCGKTIEGEGAAFCPYCGTKLAAAEAPAEPRNEEADKWVRKAAGITSYPEKKKVLLKGLEACPGSLGIAWELLFIGEAAPRRGRTLDYSIIKCWVLEIYRKPGDFPAPKRDSMRAQLFDAPELKECLNRFPDPEQKQKEYLVRLCREYISIFLEGDNQVMGRLFGFSMERNKEKRLAEPVARMIALMKEDEQLSPEQREQLWTAMYQAYVSRAKGNEQYLN